MLRRPFVLALAALAAAALASPALAAVVHVRVEGKTQTIFGSTEPRATGANALDALESASLAGEFYYHVAQASFGRYVDQIGRYAGSGESGWVFKVNGVSPPVGADQVQLKDGDTVLWYFATFGATGGPPTLVLSKVQGRCYRVVRQNDAGATTAALGAVLQVDGKRVATQGATGAATACLSGRHGLVRATLPGAIRSNALP
ncbi:MAG TPA: DUF4430 domain-containing protein [Gaiellaceae bacterium]|nr:DUF4430 domain-containing protein [Gaiellaceae bacterium]